MKQVTKDYGKSLVDQKGQVYAPSFRYKTIPAEQFVEWGVPEAVAKNLEYIVDSFLRTHKLKEDYKRDIEASRNEKLSEAERGEALRNSQGIYAYDWDKAPKSKRSKWGEHAVHYPAVRVMLKAEGKNPDEIEESKMLEYLAKYAKVVEATKISFD